MSGVEVVQMTTDKAFEQDMYFGGVLWRDIAREVAWEDRAYYLKNGPPT